MMMFFFILILILLISLVQYIIRPLHYRGPNLLVEARVFAHGLIQIDSLVTKLISVLCGTTPSDGAILLAYFFLMGGERITTFYA